MPKRFAKRAVTRTLIKRQLRTAMAAHADQLEPGLWVLRLKAGFDRAQFPSAASDALRRAARDEIATLMQRACRPPAPAEERPARPKPAAANSR